MGLRLESTVVTGRTNSSKGARVRLVECTISSCYSGHCCGKGSLVSGFIIVGIGVYVHLGSGGALVPHLLHEFDVARSMKFFC